MARMFLSVMSKYFFLPALLYHCRKEGEDIPVRTFTHLYEKFSQTNVPENVLWNYELFVNQQMDTKTSRIKVFSHLFLPHLIFCRI